MPMPDPPTAYNAVMPCPQCRSRDTKVSLVDSTTKRMGVPIDKHVVWECNVCHHKFGPGRAQELRPVLVCGTCKTFTPHEFLGAEPHEWQGIPGETRPVHNAFVQRWRCMKCGTTRKYGAM